MENNNSRRFIVRSTEVVHVHEPQSEPEKAERNRTSLRTIISLIKRCGEAKGLTITEEEMAGKIAVPEKQLNAYLNGEGLVPDILPSTLRAAYADLLDAMQMESNRNALKGGIVLIRNRGLAVGMNITAEEMARKTGLSVEQLVAYLNGGYDTKESLASILQSAYKDLLEGVERVEVIEDIDRYYRRMIISELQSYIAAIEKNSSLYDEKSFDGRIGVIDFIGFQIIDRIDDLLQKTTQLDELILLRHRAEKARAQLEQIDRMLFQKLQAAIRTEEYTGKKFKDLVAGYVDFGVTGNAHQEETAYDNLDVFINGLFPVQTMPEQTRDLEPEMVSYQKTPARIVFELVETCPLTKEDVFFDLGSGLGQVAILVNLLAGITVKGIEFEPSFCDFAGDFAAQLNLSHVSFINVDARKADYSEGTLFFMYTPFRGEILQEVLERLRKESLQRKIKIITYGPCVATVALQSWLEAATPGNNLYRPSVFNSV